MMVLDTYVVSEIRRVRPDPVVLSWLDAQQPGELWLSAVVAAAPVYADLVSQRERTGCPIGMADAQIAASC